MSGGRSAPAAQNIHGGAVAVSDFGLLILGASGSGKSALAARMMADWPFGMVRLVADDRVLLSSAGGRIIARPHAAIAGRIELRGCGIVAAPALDAVTLHGVLRIEAPAARLPDPGELTETFLGCTLPKAVLPTGEGAFPRLVALWPFFRQRIEALRSINERAP